MTETFIQGKELGIVGCTTCRLVVRIDAENTYCPRCNTHLQFRKTDSVIRTWALLISALVMYVPANTQPVMRTSYLGVESADTILGGVIYFFQQGDWPLAFIVFI
ncbi:MAG: paraquat-inducible protein A, partial [Thiohalomonadales bacterium]